MYRIAVMSEEFVFLLKGPGLEKFGFGRLRVSGCTEKVCGSGRTPLHKVLRVGRYGL